MAGGEEKAGVVSSGSKNDEAADDPFALHARRSGAPTPVPIYLVGPVEVRKLFGKGTSDSELSRGLSERSTGTASKSKKTKSHRRSSKGESGAGAVEKTKKRSGSSGRHRRKKGAGYESDGDKAEGSESFRTVKRKNIFSAPKSKSDAGKARSRKSGGGSKGRKGRKGNF
jgi:hypothetical protein